jgi:hypothetical protein
MPRSIQTRLGRVLAACFLGFSGLAMAQAPGPGMEKSADFRVSIDAQGKLVSATPLDASLGENILRAIVGAAKGITFAPAMRDGKPASFETQLHATVRFVAQPDGTYKLEMLSASLSPQAIERKSPVFPRGLDPRHAGGVVAASVVVGTDGHVDASRTKLIKSAAAPGSEKGLPRLEQAALAALAGNTYVPDRVDGQAVATEMLQTFRFCLDDCGKLAEPDLAAERSRLPRIVDVDASPARVPASLAAHAPSVQGTPLRFRVAIDASGAVTSASPLGEGDDAALAEATRRRLLGLKFLPATVNGKPVSSEMPVSVPVRVVQGVAQPQFGNLVFDLSLLSMPMPRIHLGMRRGEIHARLHVVTRPDGHADVSASRVEGVQILPTSSPALEHSVQKELEQTLRLVRVDPVQVDGKGIAIEFWRAYYSTFCEGHGSCDPPEGTPPPKDPPVSFPPGVVLAIVKP